MGYLSCIVCGLSRVSVSGSVSVCVCVDWPIFVVVGFLGIATMVTFFQAPSVLLELRVLLVDLAPRARNKNLL